MPALVTLDGSYGEGGGAVLRTLLATAALTRQALKIENIRGGTSFPGLDVEDVVFGQALALSVGSSPAVFEAGAQTVEFRPVRQPQGLRTILDRSPDEDRRGANACVVASSLLPVLARADTYSEFSTSGETYGRAALSYDAFQNVTLPALAAAGLHATVSQDAAGFGRESDGKLDLYVEPSALGALDWSERGQLREAKAIVATGHLHHGIGERAAEHLEKLAHGMGVPMEAEHIEVGSRGPGYYVTCWCRWERGYAAGTAMGQRGQRIEQAAQQAFQELTWTLRTKATTDAFLADHLILPLVMSGKGGVFLTPQNTPRLQSIIWAVKQLTPARITVRGVEGGPGTVEIAAT